MATGKLVVRIIIMIDIFTIKAITFVVLVLILVYILVLVVPTARIVRTAAVRMQH